MAYYKNVINLYFLFKLFKDDEETLKFCNLVLYEKFKF